MAYVAPWFMFLHAGRAAGVSGVSCSPSANASFPLYYAFDGRAQSLFKFGSSGAGSYIQIDRGAAGLEAIDYLIIPSGHNLGAQTVTVKAATDAGITTSVTTDTFTSAAGLITQAVTSTTKRYLRVTFAGTGTWELPELWLGRKRQPSQGVGIGWRIGLQPNYQRVRFDSGVTGGNQIGPALYVFYLPFSPISAADYAILSELRDAAQPSGERFWLQGPDGSIGPKLVELATPMTFQQINAVPAGSLGPIYSTAIDAAEAIG